MEEYCGRPKGFEEKIIKNLHRLVGNNDVLVHLGDFCIGRDQFWHDSVLKPLACKKWLVLGNHDKKSKKFYLSNGWDFVGEKIICDYYSKTILFSHMPQWQSDYGFSLNIFGHFHNNDHRSYEPQLKERLSNDAHYCFVLEHTYEPRLLRTIIESNK